MSLFNSLRESHLEVDLCAINDGGEIESLHPSVTVLGRKWQSGLMATFKNTRKFVEFSKKHHYELIIANCELPEAYVALTCSWNQKIIVVEHTSLPWGNRRAMGFFIRLILKLRNVTWVTVNSNQNKIWPFHSRAKHIPNPFVPPRERKYSSASDLVYVGRLNEGKHPEIAAEAALATEASIDFYGDGAMLASLRREFETERCRFLGFVSDPWQLISDESILIVPSEYEGDGMTVVEGILNNNPILLANNPDLQRFKLPEQNYFTDLKDLTSKIREIKVNGSQDFRPPPSLTMDLRDERDISQITNRWIQQLEEILNEAE